MSGEAGALSTGSSGDGHRHRQAPVAAAVVSAVASGALPTDESRRRRRTTASHGRLARHTGAGTRPGGGQTATTGRSSRDRRNYAMRSRRSRLSASARSITGSPPPAVRRSRSTRPAVTSPTRRACSRTAIGRASSAKTSTSSMNRWRHSPAGCTASRPSRSNALRREEPRASLGTLLAAPAQQVRARLSER